MEGEWGSMAEGIGHGNRRISGGLRLVGWLSLGIPAIPGLAIRRIDPGTGMEFRGPSAASGIPGFFAVIFAIANAPAARAEADERRR